MTKTYRAKEWLLEKGHIKKITRGRMSNANKVLLAEAAASGVQFSDFQATETTTKGGEVVIKNTAPRGESNINNVAEAFVRYPGPSGNEARANEVWRVMAKGKEVAVPDKAGHGGLKTTCANCSYSLVGHLCNDPAITINQRKVPVTIERR